MARSDCFSKIFSCNTACTLLWMTATVLLFVRPAVSQNISNPIIIFQTGRLRTVVHESTDGVTYVSANLTTIFTCFCSGNIPLSILVNGTRVTDENLVCTNRHFSQTVNVSGNYTCRLTYPDNRVAEATRNLHIVNLNEDVAVLAPSVQYGIFNDSVTLQCKANSSLSRHNIYTWTNTVGQELPGNTIQPVTFEDEGHYECKIVLGQILLDITRSVQLVVLVAPMILSVNPSSTDNVIHFTSNSHQSLTVTFRSKNSDDTIIRWYKDGSPLPSGSWTTTNDDPMNSQTSINFQPIRRSDAGEYQVTITNTHPQINSSLRHAEVRVRVTVSIPPSMPSGLAFNSNAQQLTWTYPNQMEDSTPQKQVVQIKYMNGSLVANISLDGTARHVELLTLIPAMTYQATITSFNQDGSATSEPRQFQTPPAAPSVRSVTVQRSNNDAFIITAYLHYTGGDTIINFRVSYRNTGTDDWSVAKTFPAQRGSSDLEWTVTVMEKDFSKMNSMIELNLTVVNSNGYHSSGIYREHMDVPGAPKAVSVVTSGYNSVTLRVSLPDDSATPFLTAEVYLQSYLHGNQTTNVTADSASLMPGGDVDVLVPDLMEGTEYIVTVAIYNYGGRGMPSQQVSAKTLTRPPLPVYGIALIVVIAGILVVAMVLLIVMAFKKIADHKKKKREYVFKPDGESKTLSPNHPVLKSSSSSKSTSAPTSPSPPTPSTATSVLTSPPAFISPPGFSPQNSNGIPHHSHMHPVGGVGHSFKFDSGSSRSTSVNQDGSDTSDMTSPRYVLTYPRSGEVTPHTPHTLDRMDGLRDHTPGLRDHTPYLPSMREIDGMCTVSHDMLPSASSRSRLGSADTTRSRLTGTSGLGSSSPYLHAQSSFSVNTMATRLTADTMSTQDGLLFARIESNKTDV